MAFDWQKSLTQKLGPLPAWAWGVGAGGAVVLYRRFRLRPALPKPSGFDTQPTSLTAVPFSGAPPPEPAFETQAPSFASIITPGGLSVSAEGFTPEQFSELVRVSQPAPKAPAPAPTPPPEPQPPTAPRRVSPLPQIVAPPPTPAPAPAAPRPPATPAPPTARTHTVVRGDTFWGLAVRYYGTGTRWPTIANANPASMSRPGDVGTLRIGYVLRIP